jgi:multidrug efflux system outer membrane protein
MLTKIAPSACLDVYKPMRPIIYRTGFARWLPMFFILAVAFSGCSLVPDYQRPEPLLPHLAKGADQTLESIVYSDFLSQEEAVVLDSLDTSGELKRLAVSALVHNSDYQIAMLRVEEARAEYGMAKADRMPSIQATGQMQRQSFNDRTLNEAYGQHHSSVTIGVSDYELDFFGR